MLKVKKRKAFTMIELIIIFTIIVIMTSVMITSSYKGREDKEIKSIARELVASIRETQNNALTGKQKGNTALPCAFKFGLVDVVDDSASLKEYKAYQMLYSAREINADCPADVSELIGSPFLGKMELPEGFTIFAQAEEEIGGTTVSKDHVIFTVPYGKFIVKDVTDAIDKEYKGIDIAIKKGEKEYHICVHSTGLIEEVGFNPDPDDATRFICEF